MWSKCQHVVLVGGFAASDWLFHSVLAPLEKLGLNVLRPESHMFVFLHPFFLFLFSRFLLEIKLYQMALFLSILITLFNVVYRKLHMAPSVQFLSLLAIQSTCQGSKICLFYPQGKPRYPTISKLSFLRCDWLEPVVTFTNVYDVEYSSSGNQRISNSLL